MVSVEPDPLVEDETTDPELIYKLAFIDNKVAEANTQLNKPAAALEAFEAALALAHAQRIQTIPAANVEQQACYPSTLTKIGDLKADSDPKAAQDDYSQAISQQSDLLREHPGNAIIMGNLLLSHRSYGTLLSKQGQYPPAFDEFKAALALGRELLKQDADNVTSLGYVATVHRRFGGALENESPDKALSEYQEELALEMRRANKHPSNPDWAAAVATTQNKINAVKSALAQTNGSSVSEAKP